MDMELNSSNEAGGYLDLWIMTERRELISPLHCLMTQGVICYK